MKPLFLIFAMLLSGFYSNAQKIKYKNLYILLRAKNYKDASNFLVSYLVNKPDHPNANYQMGLMLEYKLSELDLLKETDAIITRADSAILYLDKAYALITPKEVKKHDDDYYELFKRRNLRTGKFEVILSDVQLDIEDRKNTLAKKKVDVAAINSSFDNGIIFYNQSKASYRSLRDIYRNELSLTLGAVDSTLIIINSMIVSYDSALSSFKNYKKLKKTFQSSSNDIIISNETIEEFTEKAFTKPKFYAYKVVFYNFSDWGKQQLTKIKKHSAFINSLIEFDESLEKLASKIAEDSVDLSREIFRKITQPLLKDLKSLDPESLLIDIFQYKISQLNYSSTLMNWYNLYADTLDVGLQLEFVGKLNDQLDGISKIEDNLHEYDETVFMIRYHKLSEVRYTSMEELFKYVNSQAALVQSQKDTVEIFLKSLQKKDMWGYWQQDSLSLALLNDPLVKYSTIFSDSLGNRIYRIVGLTKLEDKNQLYFATVPSSRVIDSLYFLGTTIESTDLNSMDFIILRHYSNPEHIVYLIGNLAGGKYHLQLIYLNHLSGIVWNKSLKLDAANVPEINYSEGLIEIIQGDIIKKYQEEDGYLLAE